MALTLIKNATVVSMHPGIGDVDGGDVLVDGGKIAQIGRNLSAPNAAVVDGTGRIVMPGMVNALPGPRRIPREFAIATRPGSPFNGIQELMRKARAEPGKIDIGTGGVGSGMRLVSVLFQSRLGIKLNHIPYKGGNAPVLALLSGEIPIIFSSVAGITPQVESGKLKLLAVTKKKRFAPLPNVLTIAETVVPEFDAPAWYALAGEVARWTKAIRDEKIPPQD